MQIRLRKIKLTNFKGIRSWEAAFNQITNIYGENAAGKTTIFDAFTWNLFGKDSQDRKDAEFKTLDENNQVIPQIDHEVELELQVEQQVINIKRILREKWTKKRGTAIAEFTGNETLFFWNDVPLNAGEFSTKVSGLIDENLFKLITNPLFFNLNMKWQDRRNVLFTLASKIDDSEIFNRIATADNQKMIDDIRVMLNQGKTIAEYKKEIASKKKKLKDELDAIPTRVDEANRSMPQEENYGMIETKIKHFKDEIATINIKKDDASKANAAANKLIIDKQNELNQMKSKLQQLEFALSNKNTESINLLRHQISELQYSINSAKNLIENNEAIIRESNSSIASLESINAELRKKWNEVNEKKFTLSDDKTVCPSCLRKLDDDKIFDIEESLRNNFNTSKENELNSINQTGITNTEKINALKARIKNCGDGIENSKKEIADNEAVIAGKRNEIDAFSNVKPLPTEEMISLQNQINSFVIPGQTETTDLSPLNAAITDYQNQIDELNKKLAGKDQIDIINNRIKQLNESQVQYAQQLADLEGQEFVIDSFNKTRIDTMVESVNSKFKYVKFKLFSENINGGIEECCDTLVNTNGAWVSFQSGNQAGQLNAGLDIINTLCKFHQVNAPIFIDKRESINELIDTESQIINLIVSKDKQLVIN